MATRSQNDISDICAELGDELKATFFELQAISHSEGKYLFEGEWRTAQQIAQVYEELRRKDRTLFFEILLLMLSVVGATCVVILMLFKLMGFI